MILDAKDSATPLRIIAHIGALNTLGFTLQPDADLGDWQYRMEGDRIEAGELAYAAIAIFLVLRGHDFADCDDSFLDRN